MLPKGSITPSTLSIKDLPWQILWDKDKCTLCGQCTAVCPVQAIELGVFRKRHVAPPVRDVETRDIGLLYVLEISNHLKKGRP